jgi:hypothetical protein
MSVDTSPIVTPMLSIALAPIGYLVNHQWFHQ